MSMAKAAAAKDLIKYNWQDLIADASGRVECCSVQGTPRRSGGGLHFESRWAQYVRDLP